MSGKNTKQEELIRFDNLDALPPAPPLSKSVKSMGDGEVNRRASKDIDAQPVPAGFWDSAEVVEPEGTELISLRLPRRVVRHFKGTGKGYQTRISAVLASYVDAAGKKKAG